MKIIEDFIYTIILIKGGPPKTAAIEKSNNKVYFCIQGDVFLH